MPIGTEYNIIRLMDSALEGIQAMELMPALIQHRLTRTLAKALVDSDNCECSACKEKDDD
jgi:hypothetical protein